MPATSDGMNTRLSQRSLLRESYYARFAFPGWVFFVIGFFTHADLCLAVGGLLLTIAAAIVVIGPEDAIVTAGRARRLPPSMGAWWTRSVWGWRFAAAIQAVLGLVLLIGGAAHIAP
jgi:hypothetical protein